MADPNDINPPEAPATVKEPTEARQGISVHMTRYVLGIGLVLVIVGFILVGSFG